MILNGVYTIFDRINQRAVDMGQTILSRKYTQFLAGVVYICHIIHPPAAYVMGCEQALFGITAAFIIKLVVMTAISMGIGYLTAKKPPKPAHAQPAGIEQFSVPTAEEGRPLQVLFGKRYVKGPMLYGMAT